MKEIGDATVRFNTVYAKWDNVLERLAGRKNIRSILWLVLVLVIFGIVLLLNVFTPITADDFGYLYIHAEEGVRVTSIADIIHSQYNHYMTWGGRSVVHFIAQALLMLPPFVIDLLNATMYVLYIFLIYFMIKGRGRHSIPLFILVNMAVWFIQPAFGDTILWITGSANYLWGTILVLLFLLPYRLYNGTELSVVKQTVYSSLFFAYGILAGWTNENTAGAMILIAFLFLLYHRQQGARIPAWAIAGLVGALVGYFVMILAPGNALRAGEAGKLGVFIVCYRMFMHTLTLFTSHGILIIGYLASFFLYLQFPEKESKSSLPISIIFLVGALAAIYVMIFSPSFPPRAWFGALSYIIISLGILCYNLDFQNLFLRQIKTFVLLVGSVSFIFTLYLGVRDVYTFYSIYNSRTILVEQAKQDGKSSCEFERYEASTKFVHTEDELSNHLMNGYYGLEITFKEPLRK